MVEEKVNKSTFVQEWTEHKLVKITPITHNTKIFRFALPENQVFSLPVSSCIGVGGDINGEFTFRPYTPITSNGTVGYFELLIKVYENGVVTQFLNKLKIGDSAKFKGPWQKKKYEKGVAKKIGMVAGGSGLTPMLQVLREALKDKTDKTEFTLLFGNVSPEDILWKEGLDEFAKAHPQIKVVYIVDKGDENWKGETGYVTADILKKYMPGPNEDSLIYVCGPPGLMKAVSGDKNKDKSQGELSGALKTLGYTIDQVYKF